VDKYFAIWLHGFVDILLLTFVCSALREKYLLSNESQVTLVIIILVHSWRLIFMVENFELFFIFQGEPPQATYFTERREKQRCTLQPRAGLLVHSVAGVGDISTSMCVTLIN